MTRTSSTRPGLGALPALVLSLCITLTGCRAAEPVSPSTPDSTPAPTTTRFVLPDDSFRITSVTVIDVEQGIALPDRTVLVVDGLIERIVESSASGLPTGGRTIDGSGLYLMPGLVDAHVHFYDAPVFGRLMLANGVLLVRDTGMPNDYILPLRDELNRGDIIGPEMMATGWILDGYPRLIPSISLGLRTAEEARAAVQQQAAAGVDMVKVYSGLDEDVYLAILDEAQRAGLKVVGHVPESVYIEDAAAAGQSCSEHFFGFEKAVGKLLGLPVRRQIGGMGADAAYLLRLSDVDPAALAAFYERIRASGLTVCPTVVVFKVGTATHAYQTGSFPGQEYISPAVRDLWNTLWAGQGDLPDVVWQSWARMVSELNHACVPLMVGTDLTVPGILPGISVHDEMAIWQEAGISPAAVLRGATVVPARFLGLNGRLGSIAEGKSASMILVRGNPLEDVRHAAEIEAVFQRGEYHDRDDLDRLLEEAKELARVPGP